MLTLAQIFEDPASYTDGEVERVLAARYRDAAPLSSEEFRAAAEVFLKLADRFDVVALPYLKLAFHRWALNQTSDGRRELTSTVDTLNSVFSNSILKWRVCFESLEPTVAFGTFLLDLAKTGVTDRSALAETCS